MSRWEKPKLGLINPGVLILAIILCILAWIGLTMLMKPMIEQLFEWLDYILLMNPPN